MKHMAAGIWFLGRETMSSSRRHVYRRPPAAAANDERGVVFIIVLAVILAVSLLSVLLVYLAGKEIILSRNSRTATGAFYVADGGSVIGRAAVIALIQALQNNGNVVALNNDTTMSAQLTAMYGGGQASQQNPIHLLDYAGFATPAGTCCVEIVTGATSATSQFVYVVTAPDPTYTTKWLGADQGDADQPIALGTGTYLTTVTISRRLGPSGMYIDQQGQLPVPTYVFHFTYDVESQGVSSAAARRVSLTKNFDVTWSAGSFANYGYFNNVFGTVPGSQGSCSPGRGWFDSSYTFDGPIHTNERFWLAYNPTFESTVESANWTFTDSANDYCAPSEPPPAGQGLVHFWMNGNPGDVNSTCSPGAPNCTMDDPTYGLGPSSFNRDAAFIPMPQDAYSQARAALGGNPGNTAPVTNQEINQDLGLCPQGTCPSTPPPQGVYLPHSSATPPSLTGGMYVQDPDLERLAFGLDGSNRQVAVFVESGTPSSGDTEVTSVTIDPVANQTIVNQVVTGPNAGTKTATYSGTPNGMIYDSGNIDALGGRVAAEMPSGLSCPQDGANSSYGIPGSCIQQNTQLTVTAEGAVTIDDNIQYEATPINSNGTWNMSVNDILGIYAATGNINIADPAPNNIVIDAFMMSGQGEYNVVDYASRPAQGNANILGGKIIAFEGYEGTMNYSGQIVSGYGLNLTFDQRTITTGLLPPYFPLTTEYSASLCSASAGCVTDKPAWAEKL